MPACPLRINHCIQQWRDVGNCKQSYLAEEAKRLLRYTEEVELSGETLYKK